MQSTIKKLLGKQIQKIRKEKGLSQDKLSEKVGMNINSLSSIERGATAVTLLNLEKIAAALGVDVYELFLYDNPSKQELIKEKIIDKVNGTKDLNKLFAVHNLLEYID